jgi:hypothetical protein
MPNIRVRQALERLRSELNRVGTHIALHSGIDQKDAVIVDDLATDIAVTASQIAEMARKRQGSTVPSGKLVRDTQRALGFTTP